jgi:hypothetical protein
MQGLTSQGILLAWEQGAAALPFDRPLALLGAAGGDVAELAALTIGERDARILHLRAQTFGPVLDVFVTCPACHDELEFPIEISRLVDGALPNAPSHVLILPDGEVEFRLLDSRDLAVAAASGDPETASTLLVEASVLALRRGSTTLPASELTAEERALLSDRISELDPRSDILLDTSCPSCAHAWQTSFDVAAFVYAEITTAAQRLLRQVAALARAFAWTEREVLSLSAARRRAYLELAGASSRTGS